jgi:hypothetical protein
MTAHGAQEEGRIAIGQSTGRSGSLWIQHLVQGPQGWPGGGHAETMSSGRQDHAGSGPRRRMR